MKPNLHLKYERERRGWSQARVADEIGTTEKNVGRWERGVSYPYPFFREKLCILPGVGKTAIAVTLLHHPRVHNIHAAQTLVREVGGLPLTLTLLGKYLHTQAHISSSFQTIYEFQIQALSNQSGDGANEDDLD